MAQIFSPAADSWLRVFTVALAGGVVGGTLFASGLARSTYETRKGWFVDQPVPFSHQHHVGDLGLDCRFCHAEVEKSWNAGFPATHTCMTCHSKIWTGAEIWTFTLPAERGRSTPCRIPVLGGNPAASGCWKDAVERLQQVQST